MRVKNTFHIIPSHEQSFAASEPSVIYNPENPEYEPIEIQSQANSDAISFRRHDQNEFEPLDDVDGNRYGDNCYHHQQEQELFPEIDFSCEKSFKPDYEDEILCDGDLDDEYNLDDVNNFRYRHDNDDHYIKDQTVRQDEED